LSKRSRGTDCDHGKDLNLPIKQKVAEASQYCEIKVDIFHQDERLSDSGRVHDSGDGRRKKVEV